VSQDIEALTEVLNSGFLSVDMESGRVAMHPSFAAYIRRFEEDPEPFLDAQARFVELYIGMVTALSSRLRDIDAAALVSSTDVESNVAPRSFGLVSYRCIRCRVTVRRLESVR